MGPAFSCYRYNILHRPSQVFYWCSLHIVTWYNHVLQEEKAGLEAEVLRLQQQKEHLMAEGQKVDVDIKHMVGIHSTLTIIVKVAQINGQQKPAKQSIWKVPSGLIGGSDQDLWHSEK